MHMLSRTHNYGLGMALLMMGSFYMVMYYFTPLQLDDLMFRDYYVAGNGGSSELTWRGVVQLVQTVRMEENGRLPNMLCAFYVMFLPKWLGALLLAASTVGMVWTGARLALRNSTTSIFVLSLCWLLMAVLLSWRSNIFVTDIALNYVPVTWICGWLMSVLLSESSDVGRWYLTWVLMMSVIAGALHEGASLLWLGGAGVYIVLRRGRLSAWRWGMIVLFALGTLWQLSAPALWCKLAGSPHASPTLGSVVLAIPAVICLFGVLLICMAVPAWRRKAISLICTPSWLVFAAISLAGCVMAWRLNFAYGRATWFSEYFACVAIVMLANAIISEQSVALRRICGCMAYCSAACVLVAAIHWQLRSYRQHMDILRLLEQSPTGTVFYDYDVRAPKYTLKYPVSDTWIDAVHLFIVNYKIDDRIIAVVPAELAQFDMQSVSPLAGSAEALSFGKLALLTDRHLHSLDGFGVPRAESPLEITSYSYVCADGSEHSNVKTMLQRFVAPDGTHMVLVRPLTTKFTGPYVKVDDDCADER